MTPDEAVQNIQQSAYDRYEAYWGDLTVKTHGELFQRFLFAFCSVHTTWRGNVSGYAFIKDYEEWLDDMPLLAKRLRESGVGLHNNRTRYIWQFRQDFWRRPEWYYQGNLERWGHFRDRIEAVTLGLGPAKTSFALEMAWPLTCRAVCLDVHMLRLFGVDQTKCNKTMYCSMEFYWLDHCDRRLLASYPARMVYWDSIQNQTDSRYWSYVFEPQSQAVAVPTHREEPDGRFQAFDYSELGSIGATTGCSEG